MFLAHTKSYSEAYHMGQDSIDQKERLIKILNREPTDRRVFICPGGGINMVTVEVMEKAQCFLPEAHGDAAKMAKLAVTASHLASIENVGVPFCTTVEAEAIGATVDLGWKEETPRVTAYAIENIKDLGNLSDIDINTGRAKVCIEAIKILKQQAKDTPIIANLVGPLHLATLLTSPLGFSEATKQEKQAVRNLVKFTTENLIRFGDAMIEAGADVICIAELSVISGPLSRQGFEELILPYVNEMADHFKKAFNVPSIIHLSGDVIRLGDALSDILADAIAVDSTTDVKKIKGLAKCKAVMGNVDTEILEKGDPNAVFRAAMRSLVDGVDILAPSYGMRLNTPTANIRALIRAVVRADPPAPCC